MRNTQFSLFLGLSAAMLVLSGCPPTYPKCESDDHCKDKGEVCVQGQCQECATNANCKEGFVCVANKCVPKPECTGDTGCGEGKNVNEIYAGPANGNKGREMCGTCHLICGHGGHWQNMAVNPRYCRL